MKTLRKPRAPRDKPRKLEAGETVAVRALNEIVPTLDETGSYEGLPFLPEMEKYCGRTFTVRRRVEKLIQEGVGSSMRRIKDVVLLEDTLCDGSDHEDCGRACFPLWKTAWLVRRDGQEKELNAETVRTELPLMALPRGQGCQVTALIRATRPLPFWHPVRHLLELESRTYTVGEYARYILGSLYGKVQRRFRTKAAVIRQALPTAALPVGEPELRAGDMVEVRSAAEIRKTLDAESRHRGLYFMPGMWAFCGRRLRVLRPVGRMMSEKTGEMRSLYQTVILEGVMCDGKAHGGCQRGCLVFWKEAWLKRVDPR